MGRGDGQVARATASAVRPRSIKKDLSSNAAPHAFDVVDDGAVWTGNLEFDDILHQRRQGPLSAGFSDFKEYATGSCSLMTNDFVEYLRSKGYDATTSEEFDPANPFDLWDDHGPDIFGYDDITEEGPSNHGHAVCVVSLPQGVFVVDWTASQYGLTQLPLVQKIINAKEIVDLVATGSATSSDFGVGPKLERYYPTTDEDQIALRQEASVTSHPGFDTPNEIRKETSFNSELEYTKAQVQERIENGEDPLAVREMARDYLRDSDAIRDVFGYQIEEGVEAELDVWFKDIT